MASLPPYAYKPLPPQCIRVLDLRPGQPDEPLMCSIMIQPIAGKAYNALSYVWGDPTPAATVKCVDDEGEGEIGIGASLAKALISFRFTDGTRRIWVDALCINQEDLAERQSQVRMMGAVFGEAEQVLCWLGQFSDKEDGESRARRTISFLRRFNDNPHEALRVAHQHLHFEDDTVDTDGALLDSWLEIKALFDIEYFHRTWIIQEVGLARHARFFWGTQDVWLDWTEVAAFCAFMDGNGASVVNHLQLKSWVANHINMVWSKNSSGKSVYSFVEVLHWARVHHATDPRDCIYSHLSHPNATVDGSLLLQPNYSVTTAQAYLELAVNVIERTKSLHILAFVDHQEEPVIPELPTWVPDWHALNLVAPLRYPTKAAAATSNYITIIESENPVMLKCRGVLIDKIGTMSTMIEPSELTVTTLDKELQKKKPFLIDGIWSKTVAKFVNAPTALRDFLTALSVILTGGYTNDVDSTSGQSQEQQQSDFAAFIMEYENIKPQGYLGGFFASLTPENKDLVRMLASKGTARQFVQDMTWNSMCRKVFQTTKGHMGLGPRIIREGDLCVVLVGAVYPMILRRFKGVFQLVGPALMYGFMDREADKLRMDGTLIEQEFTII
jgi:Heterokaryon incompatibility protein (HET)